MVQDNQLKLALSMDQHDPAGDLSKAGLSVDYPNIDRDSANIVQFELVTAQVKSLIKMAIMSPRVKENAEALSAYLVWLESQGQEFLALAAALAPTSQGKK